MVNIIMTAVINANHIFIHHLARFENLVRVTVDGRILPALGVTPRVVVAWVAWGYSVPSHMAWVMP